MIKRKAVTLIAITMAAFFCFGVVWAKNYLDSEKFISDWEKAWENEDIDS